MANILIIDDDRNLVEMMAAILTQAGHRVSTNDSGLAALRQLGLEPEDESAALPDLILLDIMLPHSDGYTVGTVIRNRERTCRIPILVVSALKEMSPLFEATVKVDGFLNKPFDAADLRDTAAKILASKKKK